MTKVKDPRFTDFYYENLLAIKKNCALRMKSKTHANQIEKFIDVMWCEGNSKKDIIVGVVYAYGVSIGYAETMVNSYVNTLKWKEAIC